MGLIPHLVEIHETYGPQGLTILALSGQGKGTLEPFAAEKGMPYMIGYGNRSNYGVSGIPDAYLVGADGNVVWQGHPSGLSNQMLVAELEKVDRLPELEFSGSFDKILRDLDKQKISKALSGLEKLQAKSDDETDLEHAAALLQYLEEKAGRIKAEADAYVAKDNYFVATELLEELSEYGDMALAEEADALLKAWKKDKEIKSLVAASKLFEQAKQLERQDQRDAAVAAYVAAVKKAPDSQIAEAAKAKVEALTQRR